MPARDSGCVFCQIVAGKIPATKVLEGDGMLAILDIKPISPGHIVVFSTNHYSEVSQMPDEEFAKLFLQARELAEAMVGKDGVGGYNLLVCSNEVAQSGVPHRPHIHLIPRRVGDHLHLDPRG